MKYNSGWLKEQKRGHENPSWKGDNATVSSIHCWVRDNFTPEKFCEICRRPNDGSTRFDWSNKDHTYSRERKDWQHVCRGCHHRYDYEHNNKTRPYQTIGRYEWSVKFPCCIQCGTTKTRHMSKGKCRSCARKKVINNRTLQ